MRYTITNNSKAPRGVHNAAGRLVFIQPGESRTIDVAKIEGVRRLPFMHVEPDETVPAPPADLVAAIMHPEPPAALAKVIEMERQPAPEDLKSLRAEYQRVTGKRPFAGWDAAELKRRMAAA